MLNPDNVVNLGVREGAKSRREWGGVNLGVRGGVNLGGGVCKSMKRGSG